MNTQLTLFPCGRPEPTLAMVRKPIYEAKTNRLLLPLINIPDAQLMEVTICFNLFKYGYSFIEVRKIRGHIPHSWTKKAIVNHVKKYGEALYPDNRSHRRQTSL